MREDIEGWMGFVIILLARGGIMTVTGWFVGHIVGKTWHINYLLGVVLGLFLSLGVGILYIVLEKWP
jgi:hypothetical protein